MKTTFITRAAAVAVVSALAAGIGACTATTAVTWCDDKVGVALGAWARAGFSGAVAISKP